MIKKTVSRILKYKKLNSGNCFTLDSKTAKVNAPKKANQKVGKNILKNKVALDEIRCMCSMTND